MPERQWSDQVNLSNSQKTKELLPQKHKKIMAFSLTATFGQLFPFQMSFEAKLFSSPETVVMGLTWQQKAKIEMRTKATGLFTKSRRAIDEGDFRVKKKLKILNLKCSKTSWNQKKHQRFMLESTFREDWDEIGSNRAKKHYKQNSPLFFEACRLSID